jgi:hypothetical protein
MGGGKGIQMGAIPKRSWGVGEKAHGNEAPRESRGIQMGALSLAIYTHTHICHSSNWSVWASNLFTEAGLLRGPLKKGLIF